MRYNLPKLSDLLRVEIIGGPGPNTLDGTSDNDRLTGDAGVIKRGYSDIVGGDDTLLGFAGNDFVFGDAYTAETFYDGDYFAISGNIRGGNDDISGGAGFDTLVGDFGTASTEATGEAGYNQQYSSAGGIIGGDDVLNGGSGNDRIVGDNGIALSEAYALEQKYSGSIADSGDIIGGSDTLIGGAGDDILVGDNVFAASIGVVDYDGPTFSFGDIIGGDDILNGGSGDDQMWGDNWDGSGVGGDDTFVFVQGEGGVDIIWDFEGAGEVGGDLLQVEGFANGAVSSFTGLSTINGVSYGTPLSGLLITATSQQLYLIGVSEIRGGDIIFV